MKTKFVVVHENIFGTVHPDELPGYVVVLASSILRGATHSWLDGPYLLPVDGKGVRPATRKDFDDFRVCSDGFSTDPSYDFPAE